MAVSSSVSGTLSRAFPAGPAADEVGLSPASRTGTLTPAEALALRPLESSFRDIYTQAVPELKGDEPVVIGVTSAIRGDGRTTLALGLCLAIARDLGVPVLLAELDLEGAVLARELHVPEQPGLVDVLTGEADLLAALHRVPSGLFDLLPAGRRARSAPRILRSQGLQVLLTRASAAYPVTVVDLPPALSSSDVAPLSDHVNAVLVVARAGVTPARLVDQAVERCAPGKVRGVVLTGQRSRIPSRLRLFL